MLPPNGSTEKPRFERLKTVQTQLQTLFQLLSFEFLTSSLVFVLEASSEKTNHSSVVSGTLVWFSMTS